MRPHKEKTVCATTILIALGIPKDKFRHTWNGKRNTWLDVFRRNGFSVRSRRSYLPKKCSVARLRRLVRDRMKDPEDTYYAVIVDGHVLLMARDGRTVIDTAPRKYDRRTVIWVYALRRK